MKPHWNKLVELFGLLSYMVKKYDKDGLDLHFTSSGQKENNKKTSRLVNSVEKRHLSSDKANLKDKLGTLLEEYKMKLQKPRSSPKFFRKGTDELRRYTIYIFTDGIWQPHCDLEPIIRDMVDCLEKHQLRNAQVGIQFISFGDNPDAIKRLEYLDSGLDYKPGMFVISPNNICDTLILYRDIVDTEPADGNVYKMILGSINPWFDGDVTQGPTQ